MKRLFLLLVFGLSLLPPAVWAEDAQQAQTMVQETTQQVTARLKSERAQLEENPDLIYPLVQDLILPHFDFERMSRWVLGRHWRSADATQQQEFIGQFRSLLVRTYAKALLEYTDQSIDMLPLRPGERPDRATVRTEVKQSGGYAVAINYELYLGSDGWKVYDISVDGISLVTNYRASFNEEIQKGGMGGLLTHLAELNARKGEGGA